MKVYLAGPLFTTAEREFNDRLARELRRLGHDIWLPQESAQSAMTPKEIFLTDVRGIDWAEAVVACMDGPGPDSGTCWECGYAHGKKPVVVYRTDFRAAAEHEDAPYNLMLTESADLRLDLPFADSAAVAARIDQALRELGGRLGLST